MNPNDSDNTRPEEVSTDDNRADLGVLFVHGIGEQTQGETLSKFAEPIIEWCRDWLYRSSPSGASVAAFPVKGRLRPPALQSGEPAHAEVWFGTEHDGKEHAQCWLFAEAWWSPQVIVPSIASFISWLLTRGPWLLLFHLHQMFLSSPEASLGSKIFRVLFILIIWLPASLVFSLVLIVTSLAALIPLGSVRKVVYALLRTMTGVLGDSYVLVRSPIQRVALQDSTFAALKWLRGRCAQLAVVAHSQGAAVALGTLRLPGAPAVEMLVTVGAGVTKLEALRHFEQLAANERVAAALAAPLLFIAAIVAVRVRELGLDESLFRYGAAALPVLFGFAFLLVAWLTVRQALRILRERSDRVALADQQPSLSWIDIVATHDVVPAGPLQQFFDLPGVKCEVVDVLRSSLRDHTSYWGARATFLATLVEHLGTCAGTELFVLKDDDPRLQRGKSSHRKSLVLLTVSKWIDAVAIALPLVVGRTQLIESVDRLRKLVITKREASDEDTPLSFVDKAMSSVEHAMQWSADVMAGSNAPWAHATINWLVAAVVLLLLLLGWKRVAFPLWQTWAGNRYEEALRSESAISIRGFDSQQLKALASRSAGSLILNGSLGLVLLLPLIASAVWCFKPELFGEKQIYAMLGAATVVLFIVFMGAGILINVIETLDDLKRAVHDAIGGGAPKLHAIIARVPGWLGGMRSHLLGAVVFALAAGIGLAMVFGWDDSAFTDWTMTGVVLFFFHLSGRQSIRRNVETPRPPWCIGCTAAHDERDSIICSCSRCRTDTLARRDYVQRVGVSLCRRLACACDHQLCASRGQGAELRTAIASIVGKLLTALPSAYFHRIEFQLDGFDQDCRLQRIQG